MENLLEEILTLLIDEANNLKVNASNDFEIGKLFGHYESISIILDQAQSFGIFDKLPNSLQEFNPESLLGKYN